MRKKELYRTLVERYLNRTASPEELQVFFHLLEKGKLQQQLLAATQDAPATSTGRVRLMVRRYGVAAAVVVALAGVFLLWRGASRKDAPPNFVSVLHNDIDPGRDRATVTLGDGTKISLDGVGDYNRLQDGRAVAGGESKGRAEDSTGGRRGRMLYRLLVTPAGGQYRLTLADGTKVWLNSQSSIRFPTAFAGKTRLVEVTGEAFFDVAKDARRPFMVKAGKMIVQALGTQFNVHAYADEAAKKATLIQGSVRVIDGADSLLLTPGQEGETKEPGGIVENPSADTAQAAAWKDGYFDFDNLDIQAIMRQFARWYDIRIVFASKPATALFAGRLQRSLRLSQVMIGLGRMGVHSRLDGRTLTILP